MNPIVTDEWGNALMPLSIKGIVLEDGKVWLRKNEHGRWELPGGRPDGEEQPEETVVREINEELGLEIVPIQLVDTYIWRKEFGTNPIICIITFLCEVTRRVGEIETYGEAGKTEFQLVTVKDAMMLAELPEVYKQALRKIA